jgi:hypothetical protein
VTFATIHITERHFNVHVRRINRNGQQFEITVKINQQSKPLTVCTQLNAINGKSRIGLSAGPLLDTSTN